MENIKPLLIHVSWNVVSASATTENPIQLQEAQHTPPSNVLVFSRGSPTSLCAELQTCTSSKASCALQSELFQTDANSGWLCSTSPLFRLVTGGWVGDKKDGALIGQGRT